MATTSALGTLLLARVAISDHAAPIEPALGNMFQYNFRRPGIRFIRSRPIILGTTISRTVRGAARRRGGAAAIYAAGCCVGCQG